MKGILNKLKSYFLYSSEHRSGIFWLLLILVLGIASVQLVNHFKIKSTSAINYVEMAKYQKQLDSLSQLSSIQKFNVYPYNPNFITAYKGYKLGMTDEQIKRLHNFRATNKYVNSAKEFQNVTKVSDSLLKVMSPLFKFPDWATNPKNGLKSAYKDFKPYEKKLPEKIIPKDINSATKEDFMAISGIGDKISDNIIQERDKFGKFLSLKQLQFVWGISPNVISEIDKRFFVQPNTVVNKIAINDASIKELSKFPYFTYGFAKQIVSYRSMNGDFKSADDLTKINNCPTDKIELIALYLTF